MATADLTRYCAYIHSLKDGTPFYVGKASNHSRPHNLRRNEIHRGIVAKCGEENIVVTIIDCLSENMAFNVERALIRFFKDLGFSIANLTDGGEGLLGHIQSLETKEKRSISMRTLGDRNPSRRPEVRAKISAKLSGDSNPMKRPDVRVKTSEAIRAAWKNPDVIAKISGDNSPTKRPDVRAKISAAKKGMFHTPETRQKMSVSQSLRRSRERGARFVGLPLIETLQ